MARLELPRMQRTLASSYLRWARLRPPAPFDLANSGVAALPLSELDCDLSDLELNGPSRYGFAPLQLALATKAGAPSECVFTTNGASMANHLVMAALLEEGNEVLVEQPTYEPLLATARYFGAQVRRFARPASLSFGLDWATLERAVTPATRLIVLTNLHNPTGARLSDSDLERIGALAQTVGAWVLVDEVYLDTVSDPPPRSAFHLGDEFVVTSSLTKAYGLGGLRCGWVLGRPDLIDRLWRLNDLFGVVPPHPAERLSVVALCQLDVLSARAQALLAANRAVWTQFAANRDDLEVFDPGCGTLLFAHPRFVDVETLCDQLRLRFETNVTPGRFFELPDHFRLGMGAPTDVLAGGLDRLGRALTELRWRGNGNQR